MLQKSTERFENFRSFSDFKSVPQPRGENAELTDIVGSRWWLGHRVARRTHGTQKNWAYAVVLAASLSDGLRANPNLAELVAFIIAVENPRAFARGRRAARRMKQSMKVQ